MKCSLEGIINLCDAEVILADNRTRGGTRMSSSSPPSSSSSPTSCGMKVNIELTARTKKTSLEVLLPEKTGKVWKKISMYVQDGWRLTIEVMELVCELSLRSDTSFDLTVLEDSKVAITFCKGSLDGRFVQGLFALQKERTVAMFERFDGSFETFGAVKRKGSMSHFSFSAPPPKKRSRTTKSSSRRTRKQRDLRVQ